MWLVLTSQNQGFDVLAMQGLELYEKLAIPFLQMLPLTFS
jgi:hypothetical protein